MHATPPGPHTDFDFRAVTQELQCILGGLLSSLFQVLWLRRRNHS